ncbi:hypothetical protein AA313_de0200531 [Arthrobotrys entomopaga]|nr:hypothetical protein AA313_de0200531 [Arthrobotrys entomopaga]
MNCKKRGYPLFHNFDPQTGYNLINRAKVCSVECFWILLNIYRAQKRYSDELNALLVYETELRAVAARPGGSQLKLLSSSFEIAYIKIGVGKMFLYNCLGDYETAKSHCKKTLKLARSCEDAEAVGYRDQCIKTLVEIATRNGDEVEMEFYASMLSPTSSSKPKEPPAPTPVRRTLTPPPVYTPPATKLEDIDADFEYPIQDRRNLVSVRPISLDSSTQKAFQQFKVTMRITVHGKRLIGTEHQIDSIINHVLQKGDVKLAGVIFEDHSLLRWTTFGFDETELTTPLLRAIRLDSIKMVDFLLSIDSSLLFGRHTGATALYTALKSNVTGTDMIRHLIRRGYNVDGYPEQECRSDLPIYCACILKDPNSVKLKTLIAAGANVNIKTGKEEITPIMWLTMLFVRGTEISNAGDILYKASLDVLVKAGADVNAVDSDGNTALHLAAMHGKGMFLVAASRALMTHGVNQSAVNIYGRKAAYYMKK